MVFANVTSIYGVETSRSTRKPLPQHSSARLQRWALLTQGYEYKLIYRAGTSIVNTDALSRLPLPETVKVPMPEPVLNLLQHLEEGPVTETMIKEATKTDPVMPRVLQYVLQRWPEKNAADELMPFFRRRHELSCEDGCIILGTRVIVPTIHLSVLMEELHQTHLCVSHTKSLARNYVWWPSMDADLKVAVKNCHSCQLNQHEPAKALFHLWEYTAYPWSRLHVDFAVPFLGHMFLVIVDSHQVVGSVTDAEHNEPVQLRD